MQFFHFKIKKICTPLKINGVPLTDINVTKFLGLSVQSNLKWNAHVNELNTKLSSFAVIQLVVYILPVFTPA